MNYIVLDLEWNQAKNASESVEAIPFEIIDIGAVKLDDNFKEISRFDAMVKPTVYKKMNSHISELTGIVERELNNKKKFPTVIKEFLNWCGEEPYIFCTYGSQDINELLINMRYHKCNIPWKYPLKYLDIQKLFSVEYENEITHRSLETAIVFLGIKKNKIFHRAIADAIYTAEIVKKLNKNNFEKYYSVDYFYVPKSEKHQTEFNLGTHLEYITVSCRHKEDVMNLQNITTTRCPICLKKCRKKIRWFSDGNKYICIANCESHGYIEGTISFKKNYNGRYFGIRKIFLVDEETKEKVSEKKKLIKEKRKQKRTKNKINKNKEA